ncbi:MAG: hypothetical protein ACHQM7_05850 [Vicinamibacterales bacterium]
MRSSPPRPFLNTSPPRPVTPAPRPTAAQSRVKVLVAGADKDARASVEAAVRQAFAGRDPSEPWTVSLVKLGASWSVTLSGPGERFRNLSFSAEHYGLADAIRGAIASERSSSAPAPAASAPGPGRSSIEDRHVCVKCQQTIVVRYEAEPDEPKETAPVACPHCWAVGHVPIGGWAAAGGDYVAAKV